MKNEFTPGHFFMNRSLIWGERKGWRGAGGSLQGPGGRRASQQGLVPGDTGLSPSSYGTHEGWATPFPPPHGTDVCEEEEDAGEKGDDLPGQAQVVDGGGVGIGGLRGKDTSVAWPRAPTALPHVPLGTHGAFHGAVVGDEGEDDHGAEVGDHADVEGDGPKLAPLVTQQLVDGLHGQHLVAVLGGGHRSEWNHPRPPSSPRPP